MNQVQHSDLTVGNITKHLKRIAIPASVGFLFNTLFNVVDTIYAGRLSTDALAGLTLSFPIFFIIIAITAGLGNAISALASIALGQKNKVLFHQIIKNALILGVILSIIITILAPFITEPLFGLLGSNNLSRSLGIAYTNTIFLGSLFFVFNALFSGILSAQGQTKPYRNFLVIGFFMNLILDPLLIFGWFGLPRLGVIGVAIATVIVQMFGTVYLFYKVKSSSEFDLHLLKTSTVSMSSIKDILKQAIPSSLNMATIAIGIFIINYYVIKYGGTTAIAGYGAGVRIEQLALLPTLGLNIAVLTIVGQNYGANQFNRITEVLKKANLYGIIIMIIGAFIIFPFAPYMIQLFNQDPEVISQGARYLRIETLAFITYVILNICVSVLQGIKKPGFAIYIGIYRQGLPFVIFYWLGTTLNMGIDGVWWGIVLINWSAVLITIGYTRYILKSIKPVSSKIINLDIVPQKK
jgi:putative MATE family efflux protein